MTIRQFTPFALSQRQHVLTRRPEPLTLQPPEPPTHPPGCFSSMAVRKSTRTTRQHRRRAPAASTSHALAWSKDQDDLLRGGIANFGPKRWRDIATACFPSGERSADACHARWVELTHYGQAAEKRKWTTHEDQQLMALVAQYHQENWALVASQLAGRNAKQCRERWQNQLRPDLTQAPWTTDEDDVIVAWQATVGNKWATIARELTGRTDNMVKNRWYSTLARGAPPPPPRTTAKNKNKAKPRAKPKANAKSKPKPKPKQQPKATTELEPATEAVEVVATATAAATSTGKRKRKRSKPFGGSSSKRKNKKPRRGSELHVALPVGTTTTGDRALLLPPLGDVAEAVIAPSPDSVDASMFVKYDPDLWPCSRVLDLATSSADAGTGPDTGNSSADTGTGKFPPGDQEVGLLLDDLPVSSPLVLRGDYGNDGGEDDALLAPGMRVELLTESDDGDDDDDDWVPTSMAVLSPVDPTLEEIPWLTIDPLVPIHDGGGADDEGGGDGGDERVKKEEEEDVATVVADGSVWEWALKSDDVLTL